MSVKRTRSESIDPEVEDTGNLAKLVDEVIDGHAPIVVTRNGEPKAALVSLEDYALLQREAQLEEKQEKLSWEEWSRKAGQLREEILAYRGNKAVDFEGLIREMRDDLEDRDAINSGS